MTTYIALAKRGFVPLVNEDEIVIPGNLGALKKGLQALLKEDAEDDTRAEQKWAQAKALLAEESETETGAGATGSISVADDFFMSTMNAGETICQ